MVERKDIDAVDAASSFLSEISGMCCGLLEDVPISTAFKIYVDMCDFVYIRQIDTYWTEAHLRILTYNINACKNSAHIT